jgi:type VI secretion system protein ImpF
MASNSKTKTTAILSLLDRLTDRQTSDSSDATLTQGDLPMADLQAAIRRELAWLIGTTSLEASQDLSRWPNVRRSVLNYGLHVSSGPMIGNADLAHIAMCVKRSIERFEPRLRRETLRVEVAPEQGEDDHRHLSIRISGEYTFHGAWVPIDFHASMELDSGRFLLGA